MLRCGWGGNNVNINVNNNFNRNANINTGGNNNWQHNSQHRGGAPYSNQATANKYGGSAQGGSPAGGSASAAIAPAGARAEPERAPARAIAPVEARGGAVAPAASNRASPSEAAGGGYGGGIGGASASNRASPSSSVRRLRRRVRRLQRKQRQGEQLAGRLEHVLRGRLERRRRWRPRRRGAEMKTMIAIAMACAAPSRARVPASGRKSATPPRQQRTFDTPRTAADALIAAAADFDIPALKAILGPAGEDLVVTEDPVQDRNQGAAFAAMAREKSEIVLDPKNANRATLVIGDEDWPAPIPIVRKERQVVLRREGRAEGDPQPPHREERARRHRAVLAPSSRRSRSTRSGSATARA